MKVAGFLLVVMAALVVWNLESHPIETMVVVVGTVVLTLTAMPVLHVIAMRKRRHRRLLAIALAPLALVVTSIPVAEGVELAQIAVTRERGDRIAAAIAAYHARTKTYPPSLVDLVPGDLDRVPATAMGVLRSRPFEYEISRDDGFWLVFELPGWTWCRRGATTDWRAFD